MMLCTKPILAELLFFLGLEAAEEGGRVVLGAVISTSGTF